jgi:hypothetical protein
MMRRLPRLRRLLGNLSERDRKALRWGALVIVPGLLYAHVVRPALARLDQLHATVERERDLLRREVDLLADARRFPARYARGERALLRQAPRLFAGNDLVTGSAALGTYVSGIAYPHRVMVQQSEPGAPAAAGPGVARLALEVRAVSDLEGVMELLHALETGPKLVTVERLSIQPLPLAPGGVQEDQGALALAATIVGYALADSGIGAAGTGDAGRPVETGMQRR